MTGQGAGRPKSRLAAVARTALVWLRHGSRRIALGLLVAGSLGASTGAIAPAFAAMGKSDEGGGSPGGSTFTSSCPSPNPPNQLTLVAGTPQTTTLDAVFASGLQVALTNSDGCAVTDAAGVPVTFSATAPGASGVFSASNSNTVTVGADASGAVTAPTLTANGTAGSFTVTASSQYGSVSFSLTNTAAGIPAKIVAIPLKGRSARITARFPQPLQVRVLDASDNPVAGATVTFTLGSASASACGGGASAGFAGGVTQATAITAANGRAASPAFTANTDAGSFTATASLSSSGRGGSEGPGKAGAPTLNPVSFSLSNLAGVPAKIVPGVGSTQSTPAGTAFPIRLAVTVTDAQKNPVPAVLVAFSAPTAGASGRFTVHAHTSHHHRAHVSRTHTVKVKTNGCGIAVAPAFTANDTPGGYIVEATVKHTRPAVFALVNEATGQSL